MILGPLIIHPGGQNKKIPHPSFLISVLISNDGSFSETTFPARATISSQVHKYTFLSDSLYFLLQDKIPYLHAFCTQTRRSQGILFAPRATSEHGTVLLSDRSPCNCTSQRSLSLLAVPPPSRAMHSLMGPPLLLLPRKIGRNHCLSTPSDAGARFALQVIDHAAPS